MPHTTEQIRQSLTGCWVGMIRKEFPPFIWCQVGASYKARVFQQPNRVKVPDRDWALPDRGNQQFSVRAEHKALRAISIYGSKRSDPFPRLDIPNEYGVFLPLYPRQSTASNQKFSIGAECHRIRTAEVGSRNIGASMRSCIKYCDRTRVFSPSNLFPIPVVCDALDIVLNGGDFRRHPPLGFSGPQNHSAIHAA